MVLRIYDREIQVKITGKASAHTGNFFVGARAHQFFLAAGLRREAWRRSFRLLGAAVITKSLLYPAEIKHSGQMEAYDPAAGGISFSPRRHAFRQGKKFARLLPKGPIGTDVSDQAQYFITLHLGDLDLILLLEGGDESPSSGDLTTVHLINGGTANFAIDLLGQLRDKRDEG